MISEVNAALQGVLKPHLPARTAINFGAPTEDGTGKGLNIFLFEMHEDSLGHGSMWSEVRDESGGLQALQPPMRRFRLSYLITAWGSDGVQEAEILDSALTAFTVWEDFNLGNVPTQPESNDILLALDVAQAGTNTEPWEILKAVRVTARPSFTVVVTSKMVNEVFTDIPQIVEKIDLNAHPGLDRAEGPPAVTAGPPAGRRWERIRRDDKTVKELPGDKDPTKSAKK